MHVPLQAALYGVSLVGELVNRVTAPSPSAGTGSPASASAFQDTVKLAQLIQGLGSKLSSTQHHQLEALVASGNIPQAIQMLEQAAQSVPPQATGLSAHGLMSLQLQPSLMIRSASSI